MVVCSPQLPEPARSAEGIARIPASQRIGIAGHDDLWQRACRGIDLAQPAVGDYNVDTSLAAAELAAAGFGYAILLRRFAEPFLRSGRLVAPAGLTLPMARAHYLLMPLGSERPRPEVLLLRDWLLNFDWDGS